MVNRNDMQVLLVGKLVGMFASGLIIVAELDQVRALSAHGRILLGAVAVRDDDGDRNIEAPASQCDRLAVVAASCGYETFGTVGMLEKLCRIHDRGAGFERAD